MFVVGKITGCWTSCDTIKDTSIHTLAQDNDSSVETQKGFTTQHHDRICTYIHMYTARRMFFQQHAENLVELINFNERQGARGIARIDQRPAVNITTLKLVTLLPAKYRCSRKLEGPRKSANRWRSLFGRTRIGQDSCSIGVSPGKAPLPYYFSTS